MDKKQQARMEMLKALSKKKGSEIHAPKAEEFKKKKLSKVTVMSDSEEGLEKGLTKAQEILKAKLGKMFGDDSKEELEEECEECKGEGCSHCMEDEEEEETEE
jgi:hypothetical protein